MLAWVSGSHRSSLGFVAAARADFCFIENEFGFRIARIEEPTFVRYESPLGDVNVYHTRGGYRVGVEIGRFVPVEGKIIEDGITLLEAVGGIGDEADTTTLANPAETSEAVGAAVGAAARLVRRFATGLLRGDDDAFAKAKVCRKELHRRAYELGARLWEVRKAANRALERGDRTEATRLFEILNEHGVMTEADRALLAERKHSP